MEIKKGQVLWLKLPFGLTDDISNIFHPYLVLDVDFPYYNIAEIGQMDTGKEKGWNAFYEKNVPVDNLNPKETAIYTLSYLQTDRKIRIECFDGLGQYRNTDDTLSRGKFEKAVARYYSYRNKYGSDYFRDLYFTEEDILKYNPYPEWEAASRRRKEKYGK